MRRDVVVTYDIADEVRLRKVFNIMRGFGDHLQYSVFRCALSEREATRLRSELSGVINHAEDQVLFIDLGPYDAGPDTRTSTLGRTLSRPRRCALVI